MMNLGQRLLESIRRLRTAGEKPKPASRKWSHLLAGLALFFVGLVCGFWLAFPEQQLLQRGVNAVYQNTGLVLSAKKMELTFPFGVVLSECRLEPLPLSDPPVLDEVELNPAWSKLLLGSPAFDVTVTGLGGELEGVVASDGEVDLQLEGIDLGMVSDLPKPYRLAGRLSGALEGNLNDRDGVTWRARAEGMFLSGLEILGMADGLDLGRLSASGTIKGKTFQVASLELDEGVARVTGTGTLIMGVTPAASRVAASLQLLPGDSLPGMLRSLLSMSGKKPDPQGWYRFRINGRLDAPTIK